MGVGLERACHVGAIVVGVFGGCLGGVWGLLGGCSKVVRGLFWGGEGESKGWGVGQWSHRLCRALTAVRMPRARAMAHTCCAPAPPKHASTCDLGSKPRASESSLDQKLWQV